METNQFETLMLAITGLKAELKTLTAKMDAGFASVDKRFASVDKKLELIAQQTAKTVDDVADLNGRVSKLEGLSAS